MLKREVGFERPMEEPLPGTVKFYERHIFICTGHQDWPARIEAGGGFPELLAADIMTYASQMPRQVKLTACDEVSPGPGYDLLVFPDMVRYRSVQEKHVPALIQDHLVQDRVSDAIPHEPLAGQHVFVCVHGERDARCGACGPSLLQGLRAEIATRGLAEQVTVRGASHVGGHRFAGNLLIYPGGDWYGYVTPEEVPGIVSQHLAQGKLVRELWRGRMGLTPEEQLALSRTWLQE